MPESNEILKRLLKSSVDFVLVGGLAAITYGVSTMTQDVDVCFPFDDENIRKLLSSLEDIHPRVRAGSETVPLRDYDVARLEKLDNLYLKTDGGELDLLGEIAGIGKLKEVKKQSVVIELFGFPCRILDIGALIKSKEAMGRPKDLQVAHELRVIREKTKKPPH